MGLDVYLYRYEDFEKTVALEDEYENKSNVIWSQFGDRRYNDLTNEEREKCSAECDALEKELGLGKYGKGLKEKVEIPSSKYPDHYFKIGYFRSSYNDSGINRILKNTIGTSLSYIFNVEYEYHIKPDWCDARKKAVEALESLRKYASEYGFNVHHMSLFFLHESEISSDKEALEAFLRTKDEHSCHKGSLRSFSRKDGEFYLDEPLNVYGIILGKSFNCPCIYLITKTDDGLDWYINALEIVIETIDYVLGQDDPQKYYLHWSG